MSTVSTIPATHAHGTADIASPFKPGGRVMPAFFVPGHPAPQGSKSAKGRTKSGRVILVESSKRVKPWRDLVRMHAIAKHGSNPVSGPVSIRAEFVMPRPKSLAKSSTPPAIKRIGDIDKLSRAVLDALDGVLYADDAQVVQLVASKRIAEPGETSGAVIQAVIL